MKTKRMMLRCCGCHRVESSGSWRPGPDDVRDGAEIVYSHGYCPSCYASAVGQLVTASSHSLRYAPPPFTKCRAVAGG